MQQIKKHDTNPSHRKDLSLDIRSNTSFYVAPSSSKKVSAAAAAGAAEFVPTTASRSHTEANENDPSQNLSHAGQLRKLSAKAGSAKALVRTKTMTKAEDLRIISKVDFTDSKPRFDTGKSLFAPIEQKIEVEADTDESYGELLEENIILKEVTKKIWEKYQSEKVPFFYTASPKVISSPPQ